MDRFTEEMKERFSAVGIMPVIALDDEEDAEALADALCEGGLPAAEVTFRTAAGPAVIRRMKARHPEMLVGAGTVLSTEAAAMAREMGAEFVVSPGFNPAVGQYCLKEGIPYCPGVATATEIESVLALGIRCVKFFPAEPMGGLATIRALAAPYAGLSFMPTGGISPVNVQAYLRHPAIFAAGGSWMVAPDLLRERNFGRVGELAAEAAELANI